MQNDNIRITYPSSEKVYMEGKLFPKLRVAMRKVTLTPTVTKDKDGKKHFKENAPVLVYDTSGPYSDKSQDIDLRRGLPRLREEWILERGGVERLSEFSSVYCRQRMADHSLDSLRFAHNHLPLRALPGKAVTQSITARSAGRIREIRLVLFFMGIVLLFMVRGCGRGGLHCAAA